MSGQDGDCGWSAVAGGGGALLVLRTDAIGDSVLWSGAFETLARVWKEKGGGSVIYACQDRVAALFAACPFLDEMIRFDRGRAFAEEGYREEIGKRLRGAGAVLAVNPMLTRETLCDVLMRAGEARERVGFSRGGNRASGLDDAAYTHLLEPAPGNVLEIERGREVLRGLRIAEEAGEPRVWWAREDQERAEGLLAVRLGDKARRFAVLAGGAGAENRVSRRWGEAMVRALPRDWAVVSVGTAPEFALHEELATAWVNAGGRHVNLCGLLGLRETAVVIGRAELLLGAESAAGHMACAMGTRHVVLLGGGHFGRFMPWSERTTAVSLAVECVGCDWQCRHVRSHCVADVEAGALAEGIRTAMEKKRRGFGETRGEVLLQGSVPADGPRLLSAVEMGRVLAEGTKVREIAVMEELPGNRGSRKPVICECSGNAGRAEAGGSELTILAVGGQTAEWERAAPVRAGRWEVAAVNVRGLERWTAALNRAVDGARGEFLVMAGAGSEPALEFLEEIVAGLRERKACAGAIWGGGRTLIDAFEPHAIGQRMMWRRAVHRRVGYFDAGLTPAGAIYEFWLRMAAEGDDVFWWAPQAIGDVPGAAPFQEPVAWMGGDPRMAAYEQDAARERYWRKAWGISPREKHRVHCFADLQRRLERMHKGTRIALFGAGRHTAAMMERFRAAIEPRCMLAGILDDRAAEGQQVGGTPVLRTDRWREAGIEAVVVSSDAYEAAMAGTIRQATHGEIPILCVYREDCDSFPAAVAAERELEGGGQITLVRGAKW